MKDITEQLYIAKLEAENVRLRREYGEQADMLTRAINKRNKYERQLAIARTALKDITKTTNHMHPPSFAIYAERIAREALKKLDGGAS